MRPPSTVGRTRHLALAGLVLATLGWSCKRSRAPLVEEVWDEAPAVGRAEALGALAPPWSAPTRAVLDSGLVTYWLHEAQAPTTHLRVLLPVGDHESLRSASVVAVLQAHLQQTLASRGNSRGMAVDTRTRPDRIEIAVHVPVEETTRALDVLAGVMGTRAPTAGLNSARQEVLGRLQGPVTPDEQAIAMLVAELLGRDAASQRLTRTEVETVDDDALLAGWEQLVDPRRAILVAHSGEPAPAQRAGLRELADKWRGFGRRPVAPSALERLRATPPPPSSTGRLLAEPATALQVVPGPEGKPVVLLGRVVPTPTPEQRSLARLAQRLLQEQGDARLVVSGDVGVFILRVPLSTRDPERSLTEAIDQLAAMANNRQPQQRLFQAAQLWLGARVVQASLDGEDWTSLWSEAMDLSDRDEDIVGALTRDATSMLEPDAEALQVWLQRWLDPRSGEPGWRWLAAGTSDRIQRRLARITPLAESDVP